MSILRRVEEPWLRNSANQHRIFGIRVPTLYMDLLQKAEEVATKSPPDCLPKTQHFANT